MAITLKLNTAATSGGASPAANPAQTRPALGDLIIVSVEFIGTGSFSTPTDNSSGGNPWTPLPNGPMTIAGLGQLQCWYKTANAQDVANLTTVSVAFTGFGGWHIAVVSWTGFIHTATLDLTGNAGPSASVSTLTATGSGTQKAPAEVTYALLGTVTSFGTVTPASTYYSPDGGTTKDLLTDLNFGNAELDTRYVVTTTGGSSPEWVFTWSTSAAANIMAAAFYDKPPASGNMFLPMEAMM